MKMPWWVRLILGVVGTILSVVIVFVGVCVFVQVKYDIDVFATISNVATLTQQVDENKNYPEIFSDDDMQSASLAVNSCVPNLITYSESDGYSINETPSGLMNNDMKLTGKQVGAIMNLLINKQGQNSISFMGKELSFELIQISFSNIQTSVADFNVVVKMDFSSFKENMNKFPLNLISKYIPNGLYISSTVKIVKGETPFAYTVESKEIKINNLTEKDTENFLSTINKLSNFGGVEEFNKSIAGNFANALIGNGEINGFAYSLRSLGATDYMFEMQENVNYFIVKK